MRHGRKADRAAALGNLGLRRCLRRIAPVTVTDNGKNGVE